LSKPKLTKSCRADKEEEEEEETCPHTGSVLICGVKAVGYFHASLQITVCLNSVERYCMTDINFIA
jgi:hypothetical protein